MKKLKNQRRDKKRTKKVFKKEHKCCLEYSAIHSNPEASVFVCVNPECDFMFMENEDSGTGA